MFPSSSTSSPITPLQIDLLQNICNSSNDSELDGELFVIVDNARHNSGRARDETLLQVLAFLFADQKKVLENALEIAEEGNILQYETFHSGRVCWTVPSSAGRPYKCLHNYCPCRSYLDLSRQTLDRVMVKNLIPLFSSIHSLHVNDV